MATFTSVQSNSAASAGSVSSLAVTLGAGATLGNLLVVEYSAGNSGFTVTAPDASWKRASADQTLGGAKPLTGGQWYLVVDAAHAGGTSWTWTNSTAHTTNLIIREWNSSTGWAASPVDQATGNANSTAGTTISTGTTAATAQPSELAVASLVWASGNPVETESGLTAGWTSGLGSNTGVSTSAEREAFRSLTATGTQSASETISAAEVNVGLIATFLPAAAGPFQVTRRLPYRTPALPPVRRYRSLLPVPHQLNPPFQFSETVQRRQTWPRGLPRRGRVTFAVPPQLNPPYPFAETRQWRQPRGLWPRRGHHFEVVPPQQAVGAPAFIWQPLRHARIMLSRRGRAPAVVPGQDAPVTQARHQAQPRALLRRGRVAQVPQTQAAAAPPAWVQSHRAPMRALALIRRRFGQLLPWPQAAAPVLQDADTAVTVTEATATAVTLTEGTTTAVTVADGATFAATVTEGTATTATVADQASTTATVT